MFHIILNPNSLKKRSSEDYSLALSELNRRGIDYVVHKTQRPGHAKELASQALKQAATGIVCAGGDGTLFEIVNGMGPNTGIPLFLLPIGTGNDFRRAMRLPKKPFDAFFAQLESRPFPLDLGQMNEYFFLNVAGLGLDTATLIAAERYKSKFKGQLPYLMGVLSAARKFQPVDITVQTQNQSSNRPITLLSIANGNYIGGGMRVAPHAQINDGLFDIVAVEKLSRRRIYSLFPLFPSGRFTRLPVVRTSRCKQIKISSRKGTPITINLDGELIQTVHADFSIHPGAILMCAPNHQSTNGMP